MICVVAGGARLVDDVLHFPGREKLALLDVDRPARRRPRCRMKLVCRHRNAGVCSTSTTAATSAIGVSSCTSVSTGSPNSCCTDCSAFSPASSPGPRKLRARGAIGLVERRLEDERHAERVGDFLQRAGDLLHQRLGFDDAGAGDQEQRPIDPDLEPGQSSCAGRSRQLRGAIGARRAHEAGEQRMAVARRRGELRDGTASPRTTDDPAAR